MKKKTKLTRLKCFFINTLVLKIIIMKKHIFKTFLLLILFSNSSCFFDGFSDPNICFSAYLGDKGFNHKNEFILDKDTLTLESINYTISDLKLVNEERVGFVNSLANLGRGACFDIQDYTCDNYNISFKFGLDFVEKDYQILKDKGLKIENGYYFLRMSFRNKTNDSIYKYDIARLNKNSKIKPFTNKFKDFYNCGGYFVTYAEIGVDLKKLFTTPNKIDLNLLNENQIYNIDLQLKMMENAQNIFFLKEFSYD